MAGQGTLHAALPILAPFPDVRLCSLIPGQEWAACLEAWESGLELYLVLHSQNLSAALAAEPSTLTAFLLSYMQQLSYGTTSISKKLKCLCFLLAHRMLDENEILPETLSTLDFLGSFCRVYAHTTASSGTIDAVWSRLHLDTRAESVKNKMALMQALNEPFTGVDDDADNLLLTTLALLKASHNYGGFLMLGSDLLDALVAGWKDKPPQRQRKVTVITYHCLMSLVRGGRQNVSLLLDHLYSLGASAEQAQKDDHSSSLLADLVTKTPLIRKLQKSIPGSYTGRMASVLVVLNSIKTTSSFEHREPFPHILEDGKTLDSGYDHGTLGGLSIHRASLVSQIQDLFPHLGTSFILNLLDKYQDDTSQVTAHLLDNSSLHSDSHHLDSRSTVSLHQNPAAAINSHPLPAISSTRRNVFDGDALDNLAVPASSLYLGRRGTSVDPSTASNKAAILAALATFDPDSDERDDTYDADDVGGTVDTSVPSVNNHPELDRKNEAIEGRSFIPSTEGRKLKQVDDAELMATPGTQRQLPSTSWRIGEVTHESEGNEDILPRRGFRGGRAGTNMGLGRNRIDRGNVDGPTEEKSTQVARQKKNLHKGSRANHNRRDQRAKKMARAGVL